MNHSFVCIDISLLKNKLRHNLEDIFFQVMQLSFCLCSMCVNSKLPRTRYGINAIWHGKSGGPRCCVVIRREILFSGIG